MSNLCDRITLRKFLASKGEKRLFFRPLLMAQLNDVIDDLIITNASPELLSKLDSNAEHLISANGDILKLILEFLNAHWADILAIILKLLGI